MDMDLREVFCTKPSFGSSIISSVFMEEEQSHPWLRPLGLVEEFCSPPPLGARGSLMVIDDYSEGQLDASPFPMKERARRHVAKGRGRVRVSLINNMVRLRTGLSRQIDRNTLSRHSSRLPASPQTLFSKAFLHQHGIANSRTCRFASLIRRDLRN